MALSGPLRKKPGPGGQGKSMAVRFLLDNHSLAQRDWRPSSECESSRRAVAERKMETIWNS